MSTLKHPTISAWQRTEDGGYAAEIQGFQLHVRWHPERPGEQRGFSWEAKRGELPSFVSRDIHEEIELAMAAAEAHAEHASIDTGSLHGEATPHA